MLVYVIPISENDCPVLDSVAAMLPRAGEAEDLVDATGPLPAADDARPKNKCLKRKYIKLFSV